MCPTPRFEKQQLPLPGSSASGTQPRTKVDFGVVMESTDSGLTVERPVLCLTIYMGLHKVYKSCSFLDTGNPVPTTLLKSESRPSSRAQPTEVPASKEEEDPSLAQPPSTSLPSTLPAARSTVSTDAPTQANGARRQLTFSADATATVSTGGGECGLAVSAAKPSKLPRAPAHAASSRVSSPAASSPASPPTGSAAAKPATRSPGYMAATASSAAKAKPAVKRASGSSSSSSASSTAASPTKATPTKSASPGAAAPAPRAQGPSPSNSEAPGHVQGVYEQARPGNWHAKTGGVWIPRLNLAPVHAALAQAQAVQ